MASQEHGIQNKIVNVITLLSILLLGGFVLWCWQKGILTDQVKMEAFVAGFGGYAEVIFFLLQIVQVIFPFIPGGVSCLGGVVLFGPWKGFWMNYLGICSGSLIVFLLSKRYGSAVMHRFFKEESIEKYRGWTEKGHRFAILFAAAVAMPGFPDDLLCYLAGTTSMKVLTFILIMLLAKPLSLAAYSVGVDWILKTIVSLFG